jgi:hypothetical protein
VVQISASINSEEVHGTGVTRTKGAAKLKERLLKKVNTSFNPGS